MAIMISIPTFQTLIHFLLSTGYNLCPLTWSPRSLFCIPYLSLPSLSSHQTELFKAHRHKCALGKVLLWLYDRCEGFLRGLLKWFLSFFSLLPYSQQNLLGFILLLNHSHDLIMGRIMQHCGDLFIWVFLHLWAVWSQDHVSLMASALMLKPIV